MSWWLIKQFLTSSHVIAFVLGIVATVAVWLLLKSLWYSVRFYGKVVIVGVIVLGIGWLILEVS